MRHTLLLGLLLTGILSVSGCTVDPNTGTVDLSGIFVGVQALTPSPAAPQPVETSATEPALAEETAPVEGADPVVATATPVPPPTASLTMLSARGNIRGGPGLQYQVLTVATRGTEFAIVGKNEDGSWWQICCIAASGEAATRGWVASSIVETTGELAQVPIVGALLHEDLEARWSVDYRCESDRCQVPTCTAEMTATARKLTGGRWLEIERRITWAEGCGDDSFWLHQIEIFTGAERYPMADDLPLFRYWLGAQTEPANALIGLPDGRQVGVLCVDSGDLEVDEGDGWTSVYDGTACHDVRTGMLVRLDYIKSWLYTGEFGGNRYERAFFGDSEYYRLDMEEVNAILNFVE